MGVSVSDMGSLLVDQIRGERELVQTCRTFSGWCTSMTLLTRARQGDLCVFR